MFREWLEIDRNLQYLGTMLEAADYQHYSIEVNYRTTKDELLDRYAKLVLGYVSAAIKKNGYHVKHVFSDKPMRILIATQNWEDGEWVSILCYNHHQCAFVRSAGYWNKDRQTVSVQEEETQKLNVTGASELVDKILNYMHGLKKRDGRKINRLKPSLLKRGPKS